MARIDVSKSPVAASFRMETWDIRERDVDMLLIEEFYSSPKFRQRFLELIKRNVPTKFIGVRHSVISPVGQSDVEIQLEAAGRRWIVMIENKIAAKFQREQAARYAERAKRYKENGYAEAICVLIGPKKYLGGNKYGFDETVYYEDLVTWLNEAKGLGDRRVCKVALLKAAIEKCETIAKAKDPRAVAFYHKYWELASTIAPEPRMTDDPRGGGFLYFRPANVPKNVDLMHRIRKGYVDIQFRGEGRSTDKLRSSFSEVLNGLEVRRVHGSAAIGIEVPKLDRTQEFEKQKENAEKGIREVQRLWAWFLENQTLWLRWEKNGQSRLKPRTDAKIF